MSRITVILMTLAVLMSTVFAALAQTPTPTPFPPPPLVPTPTGPYIPPLNPYEVDRGTLAFGERVEASIEPPSISHLYAFDAVAGDVFSIEFEPFATNLTLEVRDPSGLGLMSYYPGSVSEVFRGEPLIIPVPGRYRLVVVNNNTPSFSAQYAVRLGRITPIPLALGAVVSGELTSAEPYHVYRFAAQAGVPLSVTLRSPTFQSRFAFFAPGSSYPVPNSGGYSNVTNIAHQLLVPAVTGDYLWVVSSLYGTPPGAASFSVIARGLEIPPLTYGETVDLSFTADDRAIAFQLDMLMPEWVNLRVEGDDGLDTSMTLYDSAGNVMGGDDDSGAGFDPELVGYQLPFVGRMYIVVEMLDAVAQGSARLTLERASQVSIAIGEPVTLTLRAKLRTVTAIFEAQAGQRYRLNAELLPSEGAFPNVVIHQGGTQIAAMNAQNTSALSLDFVAPEDGPVVIMFNDSSSVGVEARLRVETVTP